MEDVGCGCGAGGEGKGVAGVLKGCDGFLEVVAGGALAIIVWGGVAHTYRLGFEEREYS